MIILVKEEYVWNKTHVSVLLYDNDQQWGGVRVLYRWQAVTTETRTYYISSALTCAFDLIHGRLSELLLQEMDSDRSESRTGQKINSTTHSRL